MKKLRGMFQCKTAFFNLGGYTLVVVSLCVFDFGAIKVQELRN